MKYTLNYEFCSFKINQDNMFSTLKGDLNY